MTDEAGDITEEIEIPRELTFRQQFRKSIYFLIRLALFIDIIWMSFRLAQETASVRPLVLSFLALGLGISWGSRRDDIPD